MAGLKHRFGPQRGVSSGSFRPKAGLRGNIPHPMRMGRSLGRFSPKIPIANVSVFPHVKFVTFDRNIIRSNWNAINRNPMQRAGNLIRMIARGSIRRVRRGAAPSPPGSPPRSRFGSTFGRASQGGTPPFKQIYNVPIHMGTGQMIGMVGYGSSLSNVLPPPGLHELGGRATRRVRNPHRGPQPRNARGQYTRYNVPRINRVRVTYPRRPFMVPALRRARTRIPDLWRNSFTRVAHKGFRGL